MCYNNMYMCYNFGNQINMFCRSSCQCIALFFDYINHTLFYFDNSRKNYQIPTRSNDIGIQTNLYPSTLQKDHHHFDDANDVFIDVDSSNNDWNVIGFP